ncbi:hypothetical protein [Chitinophaga sp. YR627]|uniref:hypothetical protein n=1 Tax=Chitinophaga sp. YR627 TaxID=1881041 RepID=UPI000B800E1C|nr:hypothetical protein [Chitinophaga sp. YR627]
MSIKEVQLAGELANLLYEFLPGKPHPYADQSVSFPGCAHKLGLGKYWNNGSKRPAVANLLQNTLEHSRGQFCNLMIEIVKKAIPYRLNKGNPINREEIKEVNSKIAEIGFKIPELWDKAFLESLPSTSVKPSNPSPQAVVDNSQLLADYMALAKLEPQARGYAFEKFLNTLFQAHNLAPRSAFRITG